MQLGDLKMKIKLLQDALTTRNRDMELAEENNQQLLSLLEKYDQKLDQMQEAIEMKEIERMQLEEQIDFDPNVVSHEDVN